MSWVHRLLGRDGATQLAVDAKHFAGRFSQRPLELGARGSYQWAGLTGVLPAALGANSEIFQWRYVQVGSIVQVLRKVRISAAVSTTAFAAGVPVQIEMRRATAWTVQGTLGTGVTFGTNAKKKTTHASTALAAGDVRIATTAALGVGTKTLDGEACANLVGQPGTAVGAIILPGVFMYERASADEYPFVFTNQEGFVIRSVAVPITGTWQAAIEVVWDEVDTSVAAGDGWT